MSFETRNKKKNRSRAGQVTSKIPLHTKVDDGLYRASNLLSWVLLRDAIGQGTLLLIGGLADRSAGEKMIG